MQILIKLGQFFFVFFLFSAHLVRKDMDVKEYERRSNITLRHKLKYRKSAFIAVLHFTVIGWSSTMRITHTLK